MTTKQIRQPRQGRVHLKPELVKKIVPLPAIAQGEEILLALNRHRFLTNQQVADLQFRNRLNQRKKAFGPAGAKDAADLSLQRLFVLGLIERLLVWQTSSPFNKQPGAASKGWTTIRSQVNILSPKGASLIPRLLEERNLDDERRWTSRFHQLQDTSIAHELEINDAAIALFRSIGQVEGLSALAWRDDQQLQRLARQKKTLLTALTPDGLCLVEGVTDHGVMFVPLFLEIDRQTETIRSEKGKARDWAWKIQRYGFYFERLYREDPLWRELGLEPDEVELLGDPRVLTITTNPGRVEKMVEATRKEQGRGTYLYTTRDLAYQKWGNLLASIWRSPVRHAPETSSLLQLLLTAESGPTA